MLARIVLVFLLHFMTCHSKKCHRYRFFGSSICMPYLQGAYGVNEVVPALVGSAMSAVSSARLLHPVRRGWGSEGM